MLGRCQAKAWLRRSIRGDMPASSCLASAPFSCPPGTLGKGQMRPPGPYSCCLLFWLPSLSWPRPHGAAHLGSVPGLQGWAWVIAALHGWPSPACSACSPDVGVSGLAGAVLPHCSFHNVWCFVDREYQTSLTPFLWIKQHSLPPHPTHWIWNRAIAQWLSTCFPRTKPYISLNPCYYFLLKWLHAAEKKE